MRHTYWLIPNKLCARPGPNEAPWDPQELHNAGVRAVLSVNKAEGVVPRELTRLGISYKRVTLPMATPPGEKDRRICQRRLPKAYRFAKEQIGAGRPLLVPDRRGYANKNRSISIVCCTSRDSPECARRDPAFA